MFYMYKVGWYNSYTDEENYDKGVVYASDYGTAANRVINSYGEDNVFNLFLKEIVTGNAADEDYCLSEDDLEYAFKKEE